MLAYTLTFGIVLSALVTLRAAYAPARGWFYIFKPLTTTLILALALARFWMAAPKMAAPFYASLIVAGLGFSLAGDVCLMLSDKRFIWGIVSFLLAHLCYSAAFLSRSGLGGEPAWLGLPFLAAALLMGWQVAPRARRLRWPTTVYGLVLSIMAWRAWAVWAVTGRLPALVGGLGACLFVISDTALALNRFVRRFKYAQVLVLGTYYAAQCLIAWSI